mmetsp:Transcript_88757/g.246553  ORF Transcript_88757/g.246553 Transcript_88757/m.246553 type:complete len:183 (+) Transcript_88757:58-606(+)
MEADELAPASAAPSPEPLAEAAPAAEEAEVVAPVEGPSSDPADDATAGGTVAQDAEGGDGGSTAELESLRAMVLEAIQVLQEEAERTRQARDLHASRMAQRRAQEEELLSRRRAVLHRLATLRQRHVDLADKLLARAPDHPGLDALAHIRGQDGHYGQGQEQSSAAAVVAQPGAWGAGDRWG